MIRKKLVYVLAVLFVAAYGGYVFFFAPIIGEQNAVRELEFVDVDLSQVQDGFYYGEFGYGSHLYAVNVTLRSGVISEIEVVKNRDSEHAKRAEAVIDNVLSAQSVNVDAVSGATTTSKAILKAIENALTAAVTGQLDEPYIAGLIYRKEGERVLVVAGLDSPETDDDEWMTEGRKAIWLALTAETIIMFADGTAGDTSDALPGLRVEAWVEGPVMESYPEQGGAAKIVLNAE